MENNSSYLGGLTQYISGRTKNNDILRFSFICSVAAFLLIHMYCLTNQLVNHDYALISNGIGGMYNMGILYNDEGGLSSGRFLLTAANSLSSKYTLPWFTGLLCSLYFAVSVSTVVSLLGIRNRLSVVLIAVSMAAFPTAAATLAFMYTADAYFMSLMFSCLGAFLAHRYKWGWPAGAVFFAASLGIYQSYFCFGAALLVFSLIVSVFKESISVKDTIILCVRDFISLLMGLIIYKLALELILRFTGTQLSTYMGIDHMWYLPVWELGQRLSAAFRYSFLFYSVFSFYPDYVHVLYVLMLLALTAVTIGLIINKQIYRSPLKLVILLGLIVIAPLSCSLIWVMTGSVHILMVYPVVLISVAAICALDGISFEKSSRRRNRIKAALCTVILVSVISQGATNISVSNKAYLKMDTVFKNAYAFCLKLSGRIEATEGYYIGMPVMFVGQLDESNRPIQSPIMDKEFEAFTGVDSEHSLLSSGCIPAFCSFFLGDELVKASSEQIASLSGSPEIESMNIYPYSDSLRIIDGIMVVKLGEPV